MKVPLVITLLVIVLLANSVNAVEFVPLYSGTTRTVEEESEKIFMPVEGDILKVTMIPLNINTSYYVKENIGKFEFVNTTADSHEISGNEITFKMDDAGAFSYRIRVPVVDKSELINIRGTWWTDTLEEDEVGSTGVYVIKKTLFDIIGDLFKSILESVTLWLSETSFIMQKPCEGLEKANLEGIEASILEVREEAAGSQTLEAYERRFVYFLNITLDNAEKLQITPKTCKILTANLFYEGIYIETEGILASQQGTFSGETGVGVNLNELKDKGYEVVQIEIPESKFKRGKVHKYGIKLKDGFFDVLYEKQLAEIPIASRLKANLEGFSLSYKFLERDEFGLNLIITASVTNPEKIVLKPGMYGRLYITYKYETEYGEASRSEVMNVSDLRDGTEDVSIFVNWEGIGRDAIFTISANYGGDEIFNQTITIPSEILTKKPELKGLGMSYEFSGDRSNPTLTLTITTSDPESVKNLRRLYDIYLFETSVWSEGKSFFVQFWSQDLIDGVEIISKTLGQKLKSGINYEIKIFSGAETLLTKKLEVSEEFLT